MKVLYARISTANQNIERQLKKESGLKTYIDVCSGSVEFSKRPEASNLIRNKNITEIHVKHIDRLGRNLKDILNTVEVFTSKGINLVIEDLGFSTLVNGKISPTAKLIISMFGAVAELEKNNINERTQQGREIAKAEGRYKGRKRGTSNKLTRNKELLIEAIQKRLDEGMKVSKIADYYKEDLNNKSLPSVTRTTIYNWIKKGILKHEINPREERQMSDEQKLKNYLQRMGNES